MVRRYSFLVIFAAILVPLAWWSDRVENSESEFSTASSELSAAETVQRREWIEVLERPLSLSEINSANAAVVTDVGSGSRTEKDARVLERAPGGEAKTLEIEPISAEQN